MLTVACEGRGRYANLADDPTTDLHDVPKLLEVLHERADAGNTVVAIEHNLEVIKTADMGPEGGDGGGRVVAQGTPAMARGARGRGNAGSQATWRRAPRSDEGCAVRPGWG
jgi:excinuclease UvrABC ATPase subunit